MTDSFSPADTSFPLVAASQLRIALDDAYTAFFEQLDGVMLDMLVGDSRPLMDMIAPTSPSRA